MAMKKGFCIKCITKDPKRRIFKVNSEAEKCFCPHCLKEYKPKDAIGYFNRFIDHLNDEADMTLRIARRPDISYQKYADVLEYADDFVPALLGRISSLIYQSTLRRSRFNEALLLLDLDSDRFHLVANRPQYVKFLKSSNEMANAYKDRLYKRLTFKSYFYDTDCIKLYVQRLTEIKNFKAYLQKELEFAGENDLATVIKEENEEIETIIHEDFISTDGRKHRFVHFDKNGAPLVASSDERFHTGVEKYRNSTLDVNDKKLRVIKDVMFRSNKTMYHIINLGLGFSIAMGTIGTLILIAAIFLWNININIFWTLIILGSAFHLVGIVLLVIQFILRAKVRKSRY